MNFLCAYFRQFEFNDVIPHISYDNFCQRIRTSREIEGQTQDDMKQYNRDRLTSEEVLKGLEKGFSASEDGDKPFSVLVKNACNIALRLPLNKAEKGAFPFYKEIKAYLDAWLRCSVSYGFAIPIQPRILDPDDLGEEVKGLYHGEESYIQAIEYILDKALSDEAILAFFPTKNSIDMVKDYLGILVHFLNDKKQERAFQMEDPFYVNESP